MITLFLVFCHFSTLTCKVEVELGGYDDVAACEQERRDIVAAYASDIVGFHRAVCGREPPALEIKV